MSLGLVPGKMLVTLPKFGFGVCPSAKSVLAGEQQLVFGGANCVRLKRLKNSPRNSSPSLLSGPNWVRLNKAKSKLFTPEPRSLGSVRDSSPKTKSGGETKQAVLNHSFSAATPDGLPLLHPGTTSGREPPPYEPV